MTAPLDIAQPRRGARLGSALLAVGLLAGCPIGNGKYPKPRDLDPAWRIDKLRVLAIQAEPPEVAPGETATFSALITDPDGTVGAVAWLACPTDDDGVGFGCGLDAGFDFADATPEDLAAAGFIGFEPFLTPTYTAPLDALAGLDAFEAEDGVYVLVQVAALPADALAGTDTDGFDFNDVEVAYKRLVVSSSTQPNHNPAVARFTIDGYPVTPGAVLEVDPDQAYGVGVVLTEGSDEAYRYTNADGVTEDRQEEPYVAWYADGGTVTEDVTLWGYLESTWISPGPDDAIQSGTIWAVVRDRRGGMAWASLPWRVRGGSASE